MSNIIDDEFKGNSISSRIVSTETRGNPRKAEVIDPPKKSVVKTIKGQAVRKKRTISESLSKTFLGDDTRGVAQYVLYDVLIPAAKNTIQEMFSTGLEMLLFGETRASSRSRGDREKGGRSVVSYGSFHRGDRSRNENPFNSRTQGRGRGRFDLDNIIFRRGDEAAEVLDGLCDLLDQYEQVTVADFYELAGVEGGTWADQKWGWENLAKAYCTHTRGGYAIVLPKPVELE